MLTRIVKMHLDADRVDDFLVILHENIHKIRQFPGCHGVRVLRSLDAPDVFMTYSIWETKADLEKYRHSELFKMVWKRTKRLFASKAEAWSLEDIDYLI